MSEEPKPKPKKRKPSSRGLKVPKPPKKQKTRRPTGNPNGRPPEISPDVEAQICRLAARGLPTRHIAGYLELPESTIRSWRDRGEENPKSVFGRFSRKMKKAESQRVVDLLQKIECAALGKPIVVSEVDRKTGELKEVEYKNPNWIPFMTLLERTCREFNRFQGQPVSDAPAPSVTINVVAGQLAAQFKTKRDAVDFIAKGNPALATARKRLLLCSPDDDDGEVIDADADDPDEKNR